MIALSLDRNAAGVLAMLTAGASLGYLRHGSRRPSIFLGDSGSNLLGYLLGAIAVQGALKTNAVVALFFPLVDPRGADPRHRLRHRQAAQVRRPIYRADRWHFHHRFANIGFSQRRTLLYLYGWTLVLAALALALRFVPYSDDHGHFDAVLDRGDRRLSARRAGGQRLSGAGAGDPQAAPGPPAPADHPAPPAGAAGPTPRRSKSPSRASRDRQVPGGGSGDGGVRGRQAGARGVPWEVVATLTNRLCKADRGAFWI